MRGSGCDRVLSCVQRVSRNQRTNVLAYVVVLPCSMVQHASELAVADVVARKGKRGTTACDGSPYVDSTHNETSQDKSLVGYVPGAQDDDWAESSAVGGATEESRIRGTGLAPAACSPAPGLTIENCGSEVAVGSAV